ncbi:uncharacterized protein LOC106667253 [Cimex lectularius]|uniref:Integrase catalytic domain-containing protein n=1 Tax=Cimex lectularius TaxID=79782 RepID=A0A8I6RS79_CIMLE|nr:uncharacterized protein LOC106667253 [Cimex lectularius]
MRTATSRKVVELLEERVFYMFGVTQVIICDNGGQFRSREFMTKMEQHRVKVWFTPLYHPPQANPTERVNRVVKTMMASYVRDNQRTWDKELPRLAFALKTAVHEGTGFAPAYLNRGKELARSGEDYDNDLENDGLGLDVNRTEHERKLRDMPILFKEVQDRLDRAY